MSVLLDTHALLFWLAGDERVSTQADELIRTTDVLVSVVSLWEIVIKKRVGKIEVDLPAVLAEIEKQEFRLLGIAPTHLIALEELPMVHRDPFDHLLIAQAVAEGALFMSNDGYVPDYPVDYVRVDGAAPPRRGVQGRGEP